MQAAKGKAGDQTAPMALALVLAFIIVSVAGSQTVPGTPPSGRGAAGGAGLGSRQPFQPVMQGLEEMLARALQDNPDIRVAQTKVSEAEAELNRTRLQVLQKIIAGKQAVDSQKEIVAAEEATSNRLDRLAKAGQASSEDRDKAKTHLVIAKAQLAKLETELQYLIGRQPAGVAPGKGVLGTGAAEADKEIRIWDQAFAEDRRSRAIESPMAERIQESLDSSITVEFKDKNLKEILKTLQQEKQDLNFQQGAVDDARPAEYTSGFKFTLALSNVPVGAVLQALSDASPGFDDPTGVRRPGLRFVIRDYGILATWDELPPGALLLQDFWKAKSDASKKKAPAPESKKP